MKYSASVVKLPSMSAIIPGSLTVATTCIAMLSVSITPGCIRVAVADIVALAIADIWVSRLLCASDDCENSLCMLASNWRILVISASKLLFENASRKMLSTVPIKDLVIVNSAFKSASASTVIPATASILLIDVKFPEPEKSLVGA